MGTLREDLLTVAGAALAIRCDEGAYDGATRENAWDLWCLALALLRRQDRVESLHASASPPAEDTLRP